MQKYKLWINGKWVNSESGKYFPVFNPATGAEIAQISEANGVDVENAVKAAREAFPVWSGKSQAERSQALVNIANLLRQHSKELALIDTQEHGTPFKMANFLAADTPGWFDWAAYNSRSLMGHTLPVSHDALVYLQREPVGVVALITPWNLPLLMIYQKLAPALALGNTCIIKPASINSLSCMKLAEILDTAGLPSGTVNVITGPGSSVGDMLVSNRGVDMVAFTGSSETGKAIMACGSESVKRLQLELGGKNPVIVLDDADVNLAVAGMARQQTFNSGQICGSPGRFYVHEKVYDEFLEKFKSTMSKITVGDPMADNTEMGPLVSAAHRDRVEDYIKSAISEGAHVILGGKRPVTPPLDKGYYVVPTIISGVTQNMKVAREEIFGPVACFMEKFNSDEKVLQMANDNSYGLTSWVWTRDMARGMRFANKLQAGTVVLSQGHGGGPEFPWGGYKESGIGKEGSLYGLYEYTNLKCINVDLELRK
jgi:acyl-CoA reductase-like NAD-dependent aldehyde dehydrogenase